jgi:agmatinase
VTVLQFDAHADLRMSYEGSGFNHACVMARVLEMAPIIQVGIRSLDISEKEFIRPENIFYAHEICCGSDWHQDVLDRLPDNVYLTFDLDVFDPGIMPATGTPEPGGLAWYDVLGFCRLLTQQKNLVGFDVVELCPDENNQAADVLAAKLIHKILSYRFCS